MRDLTKQDILNALKDGEIEKTKPIRLVVISDTHCQLSQVDIPEGDILIHCGDFTYTGEQKELIQFGKHLRKLPHKHKILVPGNHDMRLDVRHRLYHKDAVKWMNLEENTHLLICEMIEVLGITFFGTPMIPRIGDWAFGDSEFVKERIYNSMLEGLSKPQVVISHGPPLGIMDEQNYGCPVLLDFIQKLKPKLHLFGHCHEGYGHKKVDETVFVNASTCDRRYLPANKPYIIEVEGI